MSEIKGKKIEIFYFIKIIFFIVFLTVILDALLAELCCIVDISDRYLDTIIGAIICFCISMGSFCIGRKSKEKGLISGSVFGMVYMVIIYLTSSLICMDFSINFNTIIMAIIACVGGGLGGVIGVNFKK